MKNSPAPSRATLIQILRFGAVGLINTITGLSCIYLLIYFFQADAAFANVIGYLIGLVLSFFMNRAWTFKDGQNIRAVLPRYLVVVGMSYLLNLSVVIIGNRVLGINAYLVQLLGMAVYTPTMFVGCRLFVFRKLPTT